MAFGYSEWLKHKDESLTPSSELASPIRFNSNEHRVYDVLRSKYGIIKNLSMSFLCRYVDMLNTNAY